MASKFILVFVLFLSSRGESASLIEQSYEYVLNVGKSLAPSFMTFLDCLGEDDVWSCAKLKAGKLLDSWGEDVEKQRRMWQEAADAEVSSSGRAIEELPSRVGREVEESLLSVADMMQQGIASALSRKHHDDGGGIDSITISTGSSEKMKKKKKKPKPAKIHLVQPVMMQEQDSGFPGRVQSWVIGDQNFTRAARGLFSDIWSAGAKAVDAAAEHAVESDDQENGVEDKSSFEEQRGKKKKKKKAILKLLILGAVLKAKIATLLQILSFKLQVKFFLIALVGLGINLARFWLDLKKQHQPPQKVIYYEHAQHQHHYDHEEEPGWGPWSRSMEPEETEAEIDVDNSPYRAQIERNAQIYNRPVLTRV